MSIGLVFWVLMILWLLFAVSWQWGGMWGDFGARGNSLLLFVLFFLLGWAAFGPPIHG